MTSLPTLQGRALTRTLDELQALLASGEATSDALRALQSPRDAGLWWEAASDARLVATSRLVELINALPTEAEALAAVFALVPELRAAWSRIVLARLLEVGERRDVAALCEAVSSAGGLAEELVHEAAPSLAATPFGEVERQVLPAAAHEAPAFPVLLRALAATAALREAPDPKQGLPDVTPDDPSQAWVPGRLLQLPSASPARGDTRAVLSGALGDASGDGDAMRWALARPWAFLLAQWVFTKEAWDAERISGSLALELEPAHLAVFQRPPRVDVVVTLASGEELRCGSIGEFAQRTLDQLGVTVLGHRVGAGALDDHLGAVVEALLRREVWRFEHGTSGRRPGYVIHPAFSDACYRAVGSRSFYRLGSPVTAAVRRVAETWARELATRAGAHGSAEAVAGHKERA